MTAKQRAFANGIVEGLKPLEAYEQAGYSCRNRRAASVEAQRLLNKPLVASHIAEAVKEADKNARWNRETALNRLEAVNATAYRDIRENGFRSQSGARAFFASFDRLNELYGIEAAKPEMMLPVFVLDDVGPDVERPVIHLETMAKPIND